MDKQFDAIKLNKCASPNTDQYVEVCTRNTNENHNYKTTRIKLTHTQLETNKIVKSNSDVVDELRSKFKQSKYSHT